MGILRQRDTDLPWPGRTADLAAAECLVLGAVRHWLAGLQDNNGGFMSLAWNELARELGAEPGRNAMSGLIGLVREMRHLRRPFRYHRACCPCVSGDETALLGFLAACRSHDWSLARARAEWLVAPAGIAGLLESGARLAAALAGGDIALAKRSGAPLGNAPAGAI